MKYEGRNAVKELLVAGKNIDKILIQNSADVSDIINEARDLGIKIQFADKKVLDDQSETKRHQGIIAFSTDFDYSTIEDVIQLAKSKNEPLFILILDGIEDPHNLGSILRVAECSGVHGVIVPKHRAVAVTETVVRVSAGASEHVLVVKVTNTNQTIEQLKKMGVFVFATEMNGGLMYKTDLTGDIGIIIGSEGSGVSSQTKKISDGLISIPMYGKINSLNASVSAGIVLYEAIRQRNFGGNNIGKK